MTYFVRKRKSGYCIIEKDTKKTVFLCDQKLVAHDIKRGLNGGKGFRGMTPDFFLPWPDTSRKNM